MHYFLPSLIVGIISGFNPDFDQLKENGGKWFLGWVIRGLIAMLITWAIIWLALPGIVGPFWGIWYLPLIFFGINVAITWAIMYDRNDSFPGLGVVVWIVFVVLLIGRGCAGSGVFHAGDYRDLLGAVDEYNFNEETRLVDIKHVREVSKEQAIKFGGHVLGEAPGAIGSRYKPGDYHIQRVAGELYWVAPLEFQGFSKWWSYNHTTGYIMVSAEDRTRKPELHTEYQGKEFKFKYMPSAYWGDNLKRHLYANGYNIYKLKDFTFEIDDEMRPWWVVTALHPTIQYWGDQVDGVIIVDPETGEHRFYKVGEVPEWVDRVYPEEFLFLLFWHQKSSKKVPGASMRRLMESRGNIRVA